MTPVSGRARVLDSWSTSSVAVPPLRPWYTHQRGLSFEDILRPARRTLLHFEVLVPSRKVNDLQQRPGRSGSVERELQTRAAKTAKPESESLTNSEAPAENRSRLRSASSPPEASR